MTEAVIPVDLRNPGQVFACLGLVEAAHILLGDASGGFDWSGPPRFRLATPGDANPIAEILAFLAQAKVAYRYPPDPQTVRSGPPAGLEFPCPAPKQTSRDSAKSEKTAKDKESALPIRLGDLVDLDHWTDGSSRDPMKLYSGNRTALTIAVDMLGNTDPRKPAGLCRLVRAQPDLAADPFNATIPMAGSFNFDARGNWSPLDIGFSPDLQDMKIIASPIVEIMAIWGLQHARPRIGGPQSRSVAYDVWDVPLPPLLCRAALGCAMARSIGNDHTRHFEFTLGSSGKNRIVPFATERTVHDRDADV